MAFILPPSNFYWAVEQRVGLLSLLSCGRSVSGSFTFAVGRFIGFLHGLPGLVSRSDLMRMAQRASLLYLASIKAPHKAFITINRGHFAVFMHSDQFLQELMK
ncbi:MAG: hypothetical protein WA876_09395 [Candidatus Acidiferrales bacterium]